MPDNNTQPQSPASSAALNPPTAERADAHQPGRVFDSRRQRIEEHLAQSLACEAPLPAVLGAVGADLMHAELQVGEALKAALGTGPMSFGELDQYRGGITMLVKLAKTITQLAQLQGKLVPKEELTSAT